jgi:hypothetical protein
MECVTAKPSLDPDDGWILVQYEDDLSVKQLRKRQHMVNNCIGLLKAIRLRKNDLKAYEVGRLKVDEVGRLKAAEFRLKADYQRLRVLAADATFRKFNPPGVWGQGHGTPSVTVQHGEFDELMMDLHHLSVYEARVKLVEHLPAAAAAVRERNKARGGGSPWVMVVAGAGTHSVGPPKLEKAVIGWLVEWGVHVHVRARGVLGADAYKVPAAIST